MKRLIAALIVGGALCTPVASSAATPGCERTVAVGESVDAAVNASIPGETVCLRGGVHTDPDRQFRIEARGTGNVAAGDARWITVRSHPGELATLHGRLVLTRSSAWVRFQELVLDGSGGPVLGRFSPSETYPSPTVSGHSIAFVRVEMTSRRTGTCLHESPPQWGEASFLRVRNSRIHDCGMYPPTNHAHGVYLEVPSSRAQITDNWIYDNADRCLQMYPNADGAYVARNVLDGCGEGILFGGSAEDGFCAASDRNIVERNVISNANVRWLVEAWWGCGVVGVGNVVRGNCLWPSNVNAHYARNQGLDGTPGYRALDNVVAEPLFFDRAAKDFRLRPESPCAGRAPTTVPGP
jgi:hypothetical protein